MIPRLLHDVIFNSLHRKKIILLTGACQVGKTTLFSLFLNEGKRCLSLNCDNMDDRLSIESRTSTELAALLSGYDIVLIDEAQRVVNIGLTLKMMGDLKLDTLILVTGSSSIELSDTINEPATGRVLEYHLYPLSLQEMMKFSSPREEKRLLENRMIYGLYPEVINEPSFAKETLINLANNYLYRDLLSYKGMKKPDMLQKLVRALALQIGNEVNYNELGNMLGMDKETVESYIDLLEKSFVVFRLESFSRNMRNEIKKGKKVYFYDNGIRNAVINNFSPLELRSDTGHLWENLMVSERVKRNSYLRNYANLYFWRTHDRQEIDLIEEIDGHLSTFEFKYGIIKKAKFPNSFANNYPGSTFQIVSPANFEDFIF